MQGANCAVWPATQAMSNAAVRPLAVDEMFMLFLNESLLWHQPIFLSVVSRPFFQVSGVCFRIANRPSMQALRDCLNERNDL